MLGEINDIEVIWLRCYLHPEMGGDQEFRMKHADILTPRHAALGSSQAEIDRVALQESYKLHLLRLGLIRERFKVDSKNEDAYV